ncbi:hypothetical protein RvY_03427 [Ramazzottius varieornatus]|uniref:Uncharacterized protein n=1 Tax=Ramazzottius varieornatus TaxID=947166 RepID=A0A1D1UY85_RAMVA|nr:hypothetical protein RvY_03427 [Ramazzottius varieornatus]
MDRYVERNEAGEEWPGYVQQKDLLWERRAHLPQHYMVYDTDVLEREVKRAGFLVEKMGYINRPDYPQDARNGGREGLAVLTIKPSNS